MSRRLKNILVAVVVAPFLLFGLAGPTFPYVSLGSAYKSKVVCSAVFVSKRPAVSVLEEDVLAGDLWPLDYFRTEIDEQRGTVTTSLFGLAKTIAVYREGVGATLAIDSSPEKLLAEPPPVAPPAPLDPEKPWPRGSHVDTTSLPAGIDDDRLNHVVASAFEEPDPARLRRTRALVVVFDGRIIAEAYAPGFTAETPLTGWSMTKSVANALVGILVGTNELSLEDKDLIPPWSSPDPRSEISLDNLLRMSSGLAFDEDYDDPNSDATRMLFRCFNAPSYASSQPLAAPPGTQWSYSSGTTNIILHIIRRRIGDDGDYHAFPYARLLHRIGMRSAVMERDASGNFVASSFMFATARDWARFGLLYANDGVWDGERILPEGWVDYSRTPAPAAPGKVHGAHFWLRIVQEASDMDKAPLLPAGAFHMSGHEGQFVTIIPERKLVVVRLGLTPRRGDWDHERFVADLLDALP